MGRIIMVTEDKNVEEKEEQEVIVYICPSQLRGQVIESMDNKDE